MWRNFPLCLRIPIFKQAQTWGTLPPFVTTANFEAPLHIVARRNAEKVVFTYHPTSYQI